MAGKRFPDSREIFCVDNKNMINSWALESGRYNAAREYEIDLSPLDPCIGRRVLPFYGPIGSAEWLSSLVLYFVDFS